MQCYLLSAGYFFYFYLRFSATRWFKSGRRDQIRLRQRYVWNSSKCSRHLEDLKFPCVILTKGLWLDLNGLQWLCEGAQAIRSVFTPHYYSRWSARAIGWHARSRAPDWWPAFHCPNRRRPPIRQLLWNVTEVFRGAWIQTHSAGACWSCWWCVRRRGGVSAPSRVFGRLAGWGDTGQRRHPTGGAAGNGAAAASEGFCPASPSSSVVGLLHAQVLICKWGLFKGMGANTAQRRLYGGGIFARPTPGVGEEIWCFQHLAPTMQTNVLTSQLCATS